MYADCKLSKEGGRNVTYTEKKQLLSVANDWSRKLKVDKSASPSSEELSHGFYALSRFLMNRGSRFATGRIRS